MLAVEVLVQAVVVAFAIAEQKRCRPGLSGIMAAGEEGGMLFRVTHVEFHRRVPAVGDVGQRRVEPCPQVRDDIRQGIVEIFVFAFAKAVAAHDYVAAEVIVVRDRDRPAMRIGSSQ